ncbi:MAG TPA: zinc-binding dehydrogenase [Chloroflexota bacterium]|jgi:2-desacetyl-2-hydroxyethyl bacteriochlorophyllide A dehydrogenase|nr:zinc-binding dehydrogenase [Chloroflexota bacterium]
MSPVVVALAAPRQVELIDEPSRPLGSDEVRIRTLLSGISAGTEMAFYRGTNPYLHKRWDPSSRLFTKGSSEGMAFPITTWGYEEVGEVTEAGPDATLAPGARVFGTWGHRSSHVAAASSFETRVLPSDANPLLGIFSHIGAIALNGVLDAAPRLRETVAVFGLGVVGQLVAQLLRHAGARVIGLDLLPDRRHIASSLGVSIVLDPGEGNVAERIKELTDGRGADLCIEASGSSRALHEAVRACAYNSRVVALGFYQGEASGLFLGEEFHHNRVAVVCSQIGGLAPDLQHRWDRARLVRTFMDLAIRGTVRCAELVTQRVSYRDAASVYRQLDEVPRSVLQAVLDFSDAP